MIFIILSAIYILIAKNPLHAILGLILVFINSAVLLLSLEVHFLALIYVVVYVGAICVLFLFVIMLLNLRAITSTLIRNSLIPFFLSYLVFLVNYLYIIINEPSTQKINVEIGPNITDIHVTSFVTAYLFQDIEVVILLALLLFLAILSPIIIASKRVISDRKQDLYNAVSRDLSTVVLLKQIEKKSDIVAYYALAFLYLRDIAIYLVPVLLFFFPISIVFYRFSYIQKAIKHFKKMLEDESKKLEEDLRINEDLEPIQTQDSFISRPTK